MKLREERSPRSFGDKMSLFAWKIVALLTIFGLVIGQQVAPRRNNDNSDKILFPEVPDVQSEESHQLSRLKDDKLAASIKFAQRMNSIQSYDEFLDAIGAPKEKTVYVAGRFGDVERSNAERPKPATCSPQIQEIHLAKNNDPSRFYYPECTRVNRCSGCCGHVLLSCQPVATELRNFEVMVTEIAGDSGETMYKGKEIVTVEEHTKCQCNCKIKPENCTDKQIYVQDECSCVCNNLDEEAKCKNNNMKLWDRNLCTCQCRNINECSTGLYFDQNTCRCKQVPILSRFGKTSRTGYSLGQTQKPESVPPMIVILDATDPRRKPKDDPEYNED